MKTILATAIASVLFSGSMPGNENTITFEHDKFDAGNVTQGVPVVHKFEFTNTTEKTIFIDNASASCSCTTVSWTKEPIKPGAKGNITAIYDAGETGKHSFYFGVAAKNVEKPILLMLSANVEAAKKP